VWKKLPREGVLAHGDVEVDEERLASKRKLNDISDSGDG
jgi:hypothetical protein